MFLHDRAICERAKRINIQISLPMLRLAEILKISSPKLQEMRFQRIQDPKLIVSQVSRAKLCYLKIKKQHRQ